MVHYLYWWASIERDLCFLFIVWHLINCDLGTGRKNDNYLQEKDKEDIRRRSVEYHKLGIHKSKFFLWRYKQHEGAKWYSESLGPETQNLATDQLGCITAQAEIKGQFTDLGWTLTLTGLNQKVWNVIVIIRRIIVEIKWNSWYTMPGMEKYSINFN